MDINVMWDNEDQTAIRCMFTGGLIQEDLGAVRRLARIMLDSNEDVQNVILILDVTIADAGVARGVTTQFRRFFADWHPKAGPVILVGAHLLKRAGVTGKLTGLLNRPEPENEAFISVRTLQDARRFVTRYQMGRADV